MTPLGRTRNVLKKEGCFVGNTETRLPNHQTKDLFGFIDALALHPKRGIIALQVTGGHNGNARVKKIREDFCWLKAQLFLDLGGSIEVWDWRKLKRGKRQVWVPRVCVVEDRVSEPEWKDYL